MWCIKSSSLDKFNLLDAVMASYEYTKYFYYFHTHFAYGHFLITHGIVTGRSECLDVLSKLNLKADIFSSYPNIYWQVFEAIQHLMISKNIFKSSSLLINLSTAEGYSHFLTSPVAVQKYFQPLPMGCFVFEMVSWPSLVCWLLDENYY